MEVYNIWKNRINRLEWLVILIAVVMAIPRFLWMLTNQYNKAVIIFLILALIPFLFLSKTGRIQIGLRKPSIHWVLLAFLIGGLFSFFVYFVGWLLFKDTDYNWYVVVKGTLDSSLQEQARSGVLLFFLISLPAMIFSPLGEEFFFRGILHESASEKWGPSIALLLDSSFFGLTHLAHYGIQLENGVTIHASAWIWVAFMMLTSVMFYILKKRSGSIWTAVAGHAGFNLAMMFCVFYIIE